VDKATRAYLDRIPPDKKAQSDAYFEGGYWLQLWEFLYGTGVAVLLLQGRLSARMRDLARALHAI
jgi:STE24 endopeptidase